MATYSPSPANLSPPPRLPTPPHATPRHLTPLHLLCTVCAAIRTASSLLNGTPFAVRALLLSLPLFSALDARALDGLSFAFSVQAYPAGSTLLSQVPPARALIQS